MNFEPVLRSNILVAARNMHDSDVGFASFRNSYCNKNYWNLTSEGGFELKRDVTAADAIRDIFSNGKKYGFECATAVMIIEYKAVLETLGDDKFNPLFPKLYLHSWQFDNNLGLTREDAPSSYSKPGDVLYFKNPEVDPDERIWQGENVIKMGDDRYFGHGIGMDDSEGIIAALNKHRAQGATESAYLEDQFIYPNFYSLSKYAPSDIRLVPMKVTPGSVSASIGVRRYIMR
ncbi:protein-glutamine gamma-glutamyltransferase [Paenibacillus taihuensis]|uniref:Protein-glutamine gamma-glutamyltransferase n=1 Tax=Paenibacillus taihuensis TaxID=1156355 RepID=A0A3D9SIC7_9BACL|nr:protein-glutamine gamma-glutamyltransferase [Paenibacillus taihuensis]REE88577.1 protein-glutamine gamma-glutamyltransferase [Paenibacillus taihuensis]